MTHKTFLLCLFLFALSVMAPNSECKMKSFVEQQLAYDRVKSAHDFYHDALEAALTSKGLSLSTLEIALVVYKNEGFMEVYGKAITGDRFQKLGYFNMTASSGILGPKSKEGDLQIPEGRYEVVKFNPRSNFLLSMGINYPNADDRKRSKAKHLGNAIFIHGDNKSIGCIAIGDTAIEQLYILAIYSRQNTDRPIPVHIFPFKMTEENIRQAEFAYRDYDATIKFWKWLKPIYDQITESYDHTSLELLPFVKKKEAPSDNKE